MIPLPLGFRSESLIAILSRYITIHILGTGDTIVILGIYTDPQCSSPLENRPAPLHKPLYVVLRATSSDQIDLPWWSMRSSPTPTSPGLVLVRATVLVEGQVSTRGDLATSFHCCSSSWTVAWAGVVLYLRAQVLSPLLCIAST